MKQSKAEALKIALEALTSSPAKAGKTECACPCCGKACDCCDEENSAEDSSEDGEE